MVSHAGRARKKRKLAVAIPTGVKAMDKRKPRFGLVFYSVNHDWFPCLNYGKSAADGNIGDLLALILGSKSHPVQLCADISQRLFLARGVLSDEVKLTEEGRHQLIDELEDEE